MQIPKSSSTPNPLPEDPPYAAKPLPAEKLLDIAQKDISAVLLDFSTDPKGLSTAEAGSRTKVYGLNEIARNERPSALLQLLVNFKNPLVILLLGLGVVSIFSGNLRAMVVILVMVFFRSVPAIFSRVACG